MGAALVYHLFSMQPVAIANRIALPAAPALVVGRRRRRGCRPTARSRSCRSHEAARRARATPPFLCHARAVARRLDIPVFPALDLLELFAFVRPAQFCLPTPRGLARGARPAAARSRHRGRSAGADRRAPRRLLAASCRRARDPEARAIATAMERGGWGWGDGGAARRSAPRRRRGRRRPGSRNGASSPSGRNHAPEPPPGNIPVEEGEARAAPGRAARATMPRRGRSKPITPPRSAPPSARASAPDEPHLVLAEAGTGVGKTLGYIAPASLWAEKNEGAVWISTFTRNLQHQIAGELDRLYPDPAGEGAPRRRPQGPRELSLPAELRGGVARPADAALRRGRARADGALDRRDARRRHGRRRFSRLAARADRAARRRSALADRRGECIHSACPHYHRCFIEKSVRRARRARIVVANHALVMIQAALRRARRCLSADALRVRRGPSSVRRRRQRVLAGADRARRRAELRRWLLGAEEARPLARARPASAGSRIWSPTTRTRRARSTRCVIAARVLPGEGWLAAPARRPPARRVRGVSRAGAAAGAGARRRRATRAISSRPSCARRRRAARRRREALAREARRASRRRCALLAQASRDAARGRSGRARHRHAHAHRGDGARPRAPRRASSSAAGARMLGEIDGEPRGGIRRLARDRALRRAARSMSACIATGSIRRGRSPSWSPSRRMACSSPRRRLTDGSGDRGRRIGKPPRRAPARAHLAEPGAARARAVAVRLCGADPRLHRHRSCGATTCGQVAGAYRALFVAVGRRRARPLHRDRAAARRARAHRRAARGGGPAACWRSMSTAWTRRPWSISSAPRRMPACSAPTRCATASTCRAARCASSSSTACRGRGPTSCTRRGARRLRRRAPTTTALTRLRLRQAFGRLIRRADDCGVFVLLDRQMPSRLLGAFPDGVPVERVGLKDAVARTREFLKHSNQRVIICRQHAPAARSPCASANLCRSRGNGRARRGSRAARSKSWSALSAFRASGDSAPRCRARLRLPGASARIAAPLFRECPRRPHFFGDMVRFSCRWLWHNASLPECLLCAIR